MNNSLEFSKSIMDGVEIKICRNNMHAYKPHVHTELSLGFILEGSTDLTMREETIHYSSGDGVIIPPLTTHVCAPQDIDHWIYVMLFVNPALYKDFVRFRFPERLTGDRARKLTEFLEQLLSEPAADSMESILYDILLEFGSEMSDSSEENGDQLAARVHDYILKHVEEEIPLDLLSQLTGANKYAVIRHFKEQYTATPAAYHLQCRVAEAKKRLMEGADTLDLCTELGFYDQAHLIREFKKMYGITPGAYLEQRNG